jgi:hypothetical protein
MIREVLERAVTWLHEQSSELSFEQGAAIALPREVMSGIRILVAVLLLTFLSGAVLAQEKRCPV